jgi:hypothetical protein
MSSVYHPNSYPWYFPLLKYREEAWRLSGDITYQEDPDEYIYVELVLNFTRKTLWKNKKSNQVLFRLSSSKVCYMANVGTSQLGPVERRSEIEDPPQLNHGLEVEDDAAPD